MVYLLRNPLDPMAFRRKLADKELRWHVHYGDWIYTPLIGWRAGLELARQHEKAFPGRFLI